jgi:hypothetical protein
MIVIQENISALGELTLSTEIVPSERYQVNNEAMSNMDNRKVPPA